MATQIPINTDTTHTGLLRNITPSTMTSGKREHGESRHRGHQFRNISMAKNHRDSNLHITHITLNTNPPKDMVITYPQPQHTKVIDKSVAKRWVHMDRLPVRTVSEGRIAKETYTKAAESKIVKKKKKKKNQNTINSHNPGLFRAALAP